MIFPVQTTASRIEVNSEAPGWCRLQVNGGGQVVFPQNGYFYFIQARPLGLSGSVETLVVFIPGSTEPYHGHPFWYAPLPSFILYRLADGSENRSEWLTRILRQTREEDNVSVIEATAGRYDESTLRSVVVRYPLAEENLADTVTRILAEWDEGDFIVIPVSEGQELLSRSSSYAVDLLIGFVPERSVPNPFARDTYFFDTLSYLRRMARGDVFTEVPIGLGWNSHTLLEDFFDANDHLRPFNVSLLFSSATNPSPTDYLRLIGGYQNTSLTIPYRNGGRTLIHPTIMTLFNDSYQSGDYSGTFGDEDSVVVNITSNTERTVTTGSGQTITTGPIRNSNLGLSELPARTEFNVSGHRLTARVEKDIFREIEELAGWLATAKLELVDELARVVPETGTNASNPPVSVGQLALLDSLIQPLTRDHDGIRGRYLSRSRSRIIRQLNHQRRDLATLAERLGRKIRGSRLQYQLLTQNEKKYNLWSDAQMVMEGIPEGNVQILQHSRNLFSTSMVSGGGLDSVTLATLLAKAVSRNVSLLTPIYGFISKAIVEDAKSHFRAVEALTLETALRRRYEGVYRPFLQRFNLELVLADNEETGYVSLRPIGGGTLEEHAVRIIGHLAKFLSFGISVVIASQKFNEGKYIEGTIRFVSGMVSFCDFTVSLSSYLTNQIYTAERFQHWRDPYRNLLLHLGRSTPSANPTGYWRGPTFSQYFAFLGAVTDNALIYWQIHNNSNNPRAVRYLSSKSAIIWAGCAAGILLAGIPIAAAGVAIVVLTATIIADEHINRAINPILLYPPLSFEFYIANSYLGNGSRPGDRDGMAYNLSRNEWFHNINRQISIAQSYFFPIELVTSSRADDYYQVTCRIDVTTAVLYVGLKFYEPDPEGYRETLGDVLKITFTYGDALTIRQENVVGTRLRVEGNPIAGRSGVTIILRMYTQNVYVDDPIQKFRLIASLSDIASYYDLPEGTEITFDQLDNYPFTTRAEFPRPAAG